MNQILQRDEITVIGEFARAGVIQGKRTCPFCETSMLLTSHSNPNVRRPISFMWKCPLCFFVLYPANGAITKGINLLKLDRFLYLYTKGARCNTLIRLLDRTAA